MNHKRLTHGTILESEDEQHVLHRSTIDGELASEGMLASQPDEDDPDQTVTIRFIDIAVLCAAIDAGAVRVIRFGPQEAESVHASRSATRRRRARRRTVDIRLAALLREGHVFYGSELQVRPRRRLRPSGRRHRG